MAKNAVGWFEIPVSDMDRAVQFYETVFEVKLSRMPMGPLEMAMFPDGDETMGAGGSLVKHEEFYKPSSSDGVLIYFTAQSGDLANELGRVEAAGGKVMVEKRQIAPDVGYMGLFTDTEGNRIALHSRA